MVWYKIIMVQPVLAKMQVAPPLEQHPNITCACGICMVEILFGGEFCLEKFSMLLGADMIPRGALQFFFMIIKTNLFSTSS